MDTLLIVALLVYLVAVAVTDLRAHRIPNALTVTAAAFAVLGGALTTGVPGAMSALGGLLVGFAIFLPLYASGGFGAGDVKAMSAAGAFLGVKGALLATGLTLIAGGVLGLSVLMLLGGTEALVALGRRWQWRLTIVLATGRTAGFRQVPPPSADVATKRFPYGIAIACGTIGALAWLDRLQPLMVWSR